MTNEELERELAKAQALLNQMTDRYTTATTELVRLGGNLDQAKAEISKLRNELKSLQDKFQHLRVEFQKLKDKNQSPKDTLQDQQCS